MSDPHRPPDEPDLGTAVDPHPTDDIERASPAAIADLRRRRRGNATGPLSRYERDDVEFSRATAYFDATYALATTLLVTTLDPGPNGWSSWTDLQDSVGNQLIAFAISFVVVAAYWWLNHTFVSSLRGLTPRIIGGIIAGLAFIVLLPFTTEGMAIGGTVPTIVYAINVALVSLCASGAYLIAWRQDLYVVRPEREVFVRDLWTSLITPAVFIASIPIALVSSDVARWSWILLFPINQIPTILDRRRQRSEQPDVPGDTDG